MCGTERSRRIVMTRQISSRHEPILPTVLERAINAATQGDGCSPLLLMSDRRWSFGLNRLGRTHAAARG